MSEPHTRLDQAMTARSLELKKRWVKVAEEAGITTSALSGIRRGEYKPSAHTARALEDALRWRHGSIQTVLDGGDPEPTERPTLTDTASARDALTVIKGGRPERSDLKAAEEEIRALAGDLSPAEVEFWIEKLYQQADATVEDARRIADLHRRQQEK